MQELTLFYCMGLMQYWEGVTSSLYNRQVKAGLVAVCVNESLCVSSTQTLNPCSRIESVLALQYS